MIKHKPQTAYSKTHWSLALKFIGCLNGCVLLYRGWAAAGGLCFNSRIHVSYDRQARDDSRRQTISRGQEHFQLSCSMEKLRVKALRNSLKVTRSQSGSIGSGEVNQTTPSIRAVKIAFLMNKIFLAAEVLPPRLMWSPAVHSACLSLSPVAITTALVPTGQAIYKEQSTAHISSRD